MRPGPGSQLAGAVASFGLPATDHVMPDEPLDADRWSALLRTVGFERLSGLLVTAISEGALPARPEQTQEAAGLHRDHLAHVLRLERRLLEVVDRLDSAGVEVRVLKGAALAHIAYPDASMRLFGDVDLLVPDQQYGAARRVLHDLGARTRLPPLRADFERRFGKGAAFVCEDGLEIDLHRLLVPGYYGYHIDGDALFEDREGFALVGRSIPTLGPDLHLIHACYHAAIGHMARLTTLRDIAELALSPRIDAGRVIVLARSWEGEPVVASALRASWERLRVATRCPLVDWAESYDLSEAERRRMAAYRGARAREASRGVDALAAIPGLRGRLAFLRALLFPDREYLDAVGTGRLRWLRRGVTSLWKGVRA